MSLRRRLATCVVWAAVGCAADVRRVDPAAIRAEVRQIAAREGVDPRLVEAVAEVESAYNPWAVSPKGARGIMMLMPRTARALGVRDVQSVQENVTGGARYLRYLQGVYGGNLRLALAAYNAGPGAVAQHGGVPPYIETREYVTAVLERYYGVRRTLRSGERGRTIILAGGPQACGGSEMAYDSRGRPYIRARAMPVGCRGQRLR